MAKSGIIKAFTSKANGRANTLTTKVRISPVFDPKTPSVTKSDYLAIWDTGATNSVISAKMVADLGLAPTGAREVHGVHGKEFCNTYLICLYLPNQIYVEDLSVTDGQLGDADVLIGMDIINLGDFAVTNKDGNTVFTFRIPSLEEIDFVEQIKKTNKQQYGKVGRNQHCPCGSGKKYKKCHGK